MKKIKVLDCTLRDGGYVNNWNFGKQNITKIVNSLDASKVDIIELGFLSKIIERNLNLSKFSNIYDISNIVDKTYKHNMKVFMINYGEFDAEEIPIKSKTNIDGIRIAFHKKDWKEAIKYSKKIIDKKYKVFLQPMVTVNYTRDEFIDLINTSNKIKPYAFYIVDSFGVMNKKDLKKYFDVVNSLLNSKIKIGFHSHNNLQLSFSNAQYLSENSFSREIIIDSSVYGMGRGAGNLNTEIFLEYLNKNNNKEYNLEPILDVIDYVLKPIYNSNPWGYSLPYYLSALNNCHPNYATFLDSMATLNVKDISKILSLISINKKNNFDKDYIKKIYIGYQEKFIAQKNRFFELKNIMNNKSILIIAPGSSIRKQNKKIQDFIDKNDIIKISVNFIPEEFKTDFNFFSNKRKYQLNQENSSKLILTSNIIEKLNNSYIINYEKLLNKLDGVEDNAGMMLIKLLISLEVKRIFIAGIDGYKLNETIEENYATKKLTSLQSKERLKRINDGMKILLREYSKKVELEFITNPNKEIIIGGITIDE